MRSRKKKEICLKFQLLHDKINDEVVKCELLDPQIPTMPMVPLPFTDLGC